MRIGAVNYLNSKPLVYGLEKLAPEVRLSFDLPSRLADSLAAGRLDVALIPTVEYFRAEGYSIVSDACVACCGPVLSVKLYFRVPPQEVRRVALDEGSRTSSALTQILLAELCGVQPTFEPLPIGRGLESSNADAVLLIGDRAIASVECGIGRVQPNSQLPAPRPQPPAPSPFRETWDLGERWCQWAGLPFVFAMWIARPGVQAVEVAPLLNTARDDGVRHARLIAAREAAAMSISTDLAIRYLHDNLHFKLGRKELEGLQRFYRLCVAHGLAPRGLEHTLKSYTDYGCPAK